MRRWMASLLAIAPICIILKAEAAGLAAFSSTAGLVPPAPWQVVALPDRYNKPVSLFDLVDLDGQHVLRVRSDSSWGNLVHLTSFPVRPGTLLKWRWRLDQPLSKADIHAKATEDSPLKVCVSFDMPVENIPDGERTTFKLVQFFSKAKLPTATLCYIWGHKEAIGYEQASLFTARMRFVVLANESSPAKTWVSKERDIYADFLKAFGREALSVPAISAIFIGADADNTKASGLGYVGDLQLVTGITP